MESTNSASSCWRFTIAHDLYPSHCMLETINRYREFCRVEICRSDETESEICIYPNSGVAFQPEQIVGEFFNYMLNLSCLPDSSHLQQEVHRRVR